MTDEEHDALAELQKQVNANGEMTREIYDALFKVPVGSSKDEKPLIEMMRIVVKAWQRGSWSARAFVWLILTGASLTVAMRELIKFWPHK